MLTWLKSIIHIAALSFISSVVYAEVIFIPLYNRSADELVIIIQQIFPNVPITSYGAQIVANGSSAAENTQIHKLISKLDTPAQRLLITIEDTGNKLFSNQYQNNNVITQSGHRRYLTLNRRSVESNGQSSSSDLKQLWVSEGSPALIRSSQIMSNVSNRFDSYGRPKQNNLYSESNQNLYVVARVADQQVYIDVMRQSDSLTNAATLSQQTLKSHVSGVLGEWIDLSNFLQVSSNDRQNYSFSEQSYKYSHNKLRIKVELVN